MRPLRICAATAVAVLALAACGDDQSDAPATTPTTAATTTTEAAATTSAAPDTTIAESLADGLVGTTFLSTEVVGYTLVPDTVISLSFDADRLSANAGCNTMSGPWSVEGDVLTVGEMAQTMMACTPSSLMDQDTWLGALLTSGPTLTLDGDTLTIAADGATVTMEAESDAELEGVTWTIDSTITADAVSSFVTERTPTLTFDDGMVVVDTGCNTGRGEYTVGEGTIEIGPLATTRMACTADSAQQLETAILTVLDGTVTYEIDGATLRLMNGDVGLQLTAG